MTLFFTNRHWRPPLVRILLALVTALSPFNLFLASAFRLGRQTQPNGGSLKGSFRSVFGGLDKSDVLAEKSACQFACGATTVDVTATDEEMITTSGNLESVEGSSLTFSIGNGSNVAYKPSESECLTECRVVAKPSFYKSCGGSLQYGVAQISKQDSGLFYDIRLCCHLQVCTIPQSPKPEELDEDIEPLAELQHGSTLNKNTCVCCDKPAAQVQSAHQVGFHCKSPHHMPEWSKLAKSAGKHYYAYQDRDALRYNCESYCGPYPGYSGKLLDEDMLLPESSDEISRYVNYRDEKTYPYIFPRLKTLGERVDGSHRLATPFEHVCGGARPERDEEKGFDGPTQFISFIKSGSFPQATKDCSQPFDIGQRRVAVSAEAVEQQGGAVIDMSNRSEAWKWCYYGGCLKINGHDHCFQGAKTIAPWPYACASRFLLRNRSQKLENSAWTSQGRQKIAKSCVVWATRAREVLVFPPMSAPAETDTTSDVTTSIRSLVSSGIKVETARPPANNLCLGGLDDSCSAYDHSSTTVKCKKRGSRKASHGRRKRIGSTAGSASTASTDVGRGVSRKHTNFHTDGVSERFYS